jgi:hypothetical protein
MDELSKGDRILASDAERARVAAWLGIAFEEGRLQLAEYDRRVEAAYAAVTRGDLAELTDDLPRPPTDLLKQRLPPDQLPPPPVPERQSARGVHWAVGVALIAGALCAARSGTVTPMLLMVGVLLLAGLSRWIMDDPFGRGGPRD